jgi:hypothetical protein
MNRRKFLQAVGFAIVAFFGRSSVVGAQIHVLNPNLQKKAQNIGRNLVQSNNPSFSDLDDLVAVTRPADIIEALFIVFRESINAMNEDMQYFIEQIKKYNALREIYRDYLRKLRNTFGNKREKCTPANAIRTIDGLERVRGNVEQEAKKILKEKQPSYEVQFLLYSLERDRKVLNKARSIYMSL